MEEPNPMTLAIIIVTALVSFAAWQNPRLLDALMLRPSRVWRGELWRLIGHGLIHADPQHLMFNMITLFFFGTVMENILFERIGAVGFLLFYLSALVLSALPDVIGRRDDSSYASLGASGAVAAMLFAYILIDPWALLFVFFIPVPAVVFAMVYVGYSIWAQRHSPGNINHGAHLWGAAWGVIFMLLLEPSLLPRFLSKIAGLE
ncbi:MAG: rhomboid family intramembrane serine protease [Wenzhouxiangellaceae bacterium]|nr:rhomboid family intramembrane serine protease [Wenzhouxiangellaceae bacterium]